MRRKFGALGFAARRSLARASLLSSSTACCRFFPPETDKIDGSGQVGRCRVRIRRVILATWAFTAPDGVEGLQDAFFGDSDLP